MMITMMSLMLLVNVILVALRLALFSKEEWVRSEIVIQMIDLRSS